LPGSGLPIHYEKKKAGLPKAAQELSSTSMKPIKTVDLVLHRKNRKLLFRVYAALRKKTYYGRKK
jgi:hypothetical protein